MSEPKEGEVSVPHLQALVNRFGDLDASVRGGYYPQVRPLVTLEQFFKGSNGQASMWFNQYPDVSKDIDELKFWRSLRDRNDVWDVLIMLRQYDFSGEPFKADGGWVGSDVVVIISSASPDELLKAFPKDAEPEFQIDNWSWPEAHERVFVPSGMKPLFFWYD
ncbi:MAG: hypothetical protein ABL904_19780 [Hyphomicrobiaceae bacterium]